MASWVETSSTPSRARTWVVPPPPSSVAPSAVNNGLANPRSPMCASAVLPHHDDERVTCPLLNSRLCHHSKDLISTQDTAKTHQHRIRDKAPFRFLAILFFFSLFEIADRKERKREWARNEVADEYTLETWRTISLFITESRVWQNQLLTNKQKMHTWHVFPCITLPLLASPPPPSSLLLTRSSFSSSSFLRAKKEDKTKWSKFTSCTFKLTLCGARCAGFVSAFVTSKTRNTGECVYALWTLKVYFVPFFFSLHLSPFIRRVAEVRWHRTLISFFLPFSQWPHVWTLYFSSPNVPPPCHTQEASFFFVYNMERIKDFGEHRESARMVPPVWKNWSKLEVSAHQQWCDSPLFCLFCFVPPKRADRCFTLSRWKKKSQTLVYEASAWMLRLLCTTYYLVLLLTLLTPALKRGVYLSTCLCWTLCAFHGRSPPSLCLPPFPSWSWNHKMTLNEMPDLFFFFFVLFFGLISHPYCSNMLPVLNLWSFLIQFFFFLFFFNILIQPLTTYIAPVTPS